MASHRPLIEPEDLVGLGFRCSMSCLRPGLDANSSGCRLLAATIAAHGLPPSLRSHFTVWALAIDSTTERPITLNHLENPAFTPDERLAIALVAACQHPRCPALTACASALLGSSDLGQVLSATQNIAHTLSAAGTILQPVPRITGGDQQNTPPFPPRLH